MELEKELIRCKKELNSNNIIHLIDALPTAISLWNPFAGLIVKAALCGTKYVLNKSSEEKLKSRILMIIDCIEKIRIKQKEDNQNYEANLICPELFRKTLVSESKEKAEEYLRITECLYSTEKINFDEINEAIRIFSDLSTNEYLFIKHFKYKSYISWIDLLKNDFYKKIYEDNADEFDIISKSLYIKNMIILSNVGSAIGKEALSIHYDRKN
jgi:hypothetical protein